MCNFLIKNNKKAKYIFIELKKWKKQPKIKKKSKRKRKKEGTRGFIITISFSTDLSIFNTIKPSTTNPKILQQKKNIYSIHMHQQT